MREKQIIRFGLMVLVLGKWGSPLYLQAKLTTSALVRLFRDLAATTEMAKRYYAGQMRSYAASDG